MRAAVIVPTYRRPAELARCLGALRAQTQSPDEVLVVVRHGDAESAALVERVRAEWTELKAVPVTREGVVAAMNAALDATTADIFALTDDDAEPARDWLARMASVLESESGAAGVGGRDAQPGVTGQRSVVGRVQWFGRLIGNHHVGAGPPRDVDVLKGVCSAYRTDALRRVRFDERLKGRGAQVHWELSLCLALRRAGWRLIYDPSIVVVHHVAARHDDDQLHRGHFAAAPHEDAVFNETSVLREHLPLLRRVAFRAWSMLIGTGAEPGVLQLPRVLLREGSTGWTRFTATQRARAAAFR